MAEMNRRLLLARRPQGRPKPEDFSFVEEQRPELGPGEVLCRTIYLSLDPYMRGRMNEAKSYAPFVRLGDVMVGETVSQVVKSQAPDVEEGAFVRAHGGWQTYTVHDARDVALLDPGAAPLSTRLGVMGMPGFTAYGGLLGIGKPKAGETLVVAAATGPVASAAAQIAKIKGLRTVGIAGGPEKCALAVERFGFDVCLDRKEGDLEKRLAEACPDGVDIYVELVGGPVLQAVLPLLNDFARMPVIGTIAHYNATSLPDGPDKTPLFMRHVLVKRLTVRGMIVYDFEPLRADFERDMGAWLKAGKVAYLEDIVDGLDRAADAFIGMLEGANTGKLLVRVSDDPTLR
ncbi:MAG: NADP-dependent oxidoreductase [Geminicoccaceae bacterium]